MYLGKTLALQCLHELPAVEGGRYTLVYHTPMKHSRSVVLSFAILTFIWIALTNLPPCQADSAPKLAMAEIEPSPTLFRRFESLNNGLGTNSIAPYIEFTRAISTRLVNDFHSGRMFDIIGSIELEKVIVQKEGQFNLHDSKTAKAIKDSEIRFLLVAVLEDYQEATINQAQGTIAYQKNRSASQSYYNGNTAVTRYGVSPGRTVVINRGVASSSLNVQGRFDAHVSKMQSVTVTIRSKLYDTVSGRLLDTASYRFATNRTYVSLATESASESFSSIIEDALIFLSNKIVSQAANAAFPVKVLEKNDRELTINRRAGDNIKAGQVFNVFNPGKAIKDPTTGDVLGDDEVLVGRAYVSSLRDKFSRATVLEDNGIVPGSILRVAK